MTAIDADVSMTAEQVAAAVAKNTGQTGYIVLRQAAGNGKNWEIVKTVQAVNAGGAIRSAIGTPPDSTDSATFVAIPARSWNPVTAKTKTTTAVVLEDAK